MKNIQFDDLPYLLKITIGIIGCLIMLIAMAIMFFLPLLIPFIWLYDKIMRTNNLKITWKNHDI